MQYIMLAQRVPALLWNEAQRGGAHQAGLEAGFHMKQGRIRKHFTILNGS